MARKGKTQRQDTFEETQRDKIQELRSIIQQKDKQIRQLRRELSKQRKVEEDYEDLVEEVEALRPPEASPIQKCPDCSFPLKRLELGKFTLIHCQNCPFRKREKPEE